MTEGTRLARAAHAAGKSMLTILIENARRLDDLAAQYQADGDTTAEIATRVVLAQVTDRAAKYLHAPQMAVKHEHTMVDGRPIKPIIEISGYPTKPEPKPLPAPPLPPPVIMADTTKH